jgi:hypothetical protein
MSLLRGFFSFLFLLFNFRDGMMLRYFYFYIFRDCLFGLLFLLVSFLWLNFFNLFYCNTRPLSCFSLIIIYLFLHLLVNSIVLLFLVFIDDGRWSFFRVIFLLGLFLWSLLLLFGLNSGWCVLVLDCRELSSGFILALTLWVVTTIGSSGGRRTLCLSHGCRIRAVEETIQQSVDFTIEDLVC